jgi:hypothetical protein
MSEETGTEPAGTAKPSARVSQIRDALRPNCAFEWEVAEALNCSRRKIQLLGLPFEKIGGTRIYNVLAVREALRGRKPEKT